MKSTYGDNPVGFDTKARHAVSPSKLGFYDSEGRPVVGETPRAFYALDKPVPTSEPPVLDLRSWWALRPWAKRRA